MIAGEPGSRCIDGVVDWAKLAGIRNFGSICAWNVPHTTTDGLKKAVLIVCWTVVPTRSKLLQPIGRGMGRRDVRILRFGLKGIVFDQMNCFLHVESEVW